MRSERRQKSSAKKKKKKRRMETKASKTQVDRDNEEDRGKRQKRLERLGIS